MRLRNKQMEVDNGAILKGKKKSDSVASNELNLKMYC